MKLTLSKSKTILNTQLEFILTSHDTIRVYIHTDVNEFIGTEIYKFFNYISIWGGSDRKNYTSISWELSLTLKEYLKEKFGSLDNCKFYF